MDGDIIDEDVMVDDVIDDDVIMTMALGAIPPSGWLLLFREKCPLDFFDSPTRNF